MNVIYPDLHCLQSYGQLHISKLEAS